MNFESVGALTLPKIGFGTWKIGGEMSPNRARDAWSLAALRSALELGYTHFDTAEMYAGGHAEELLGQAMRESKIERKALFITSKVMPSNLEYERVLRSCEASLRRLGMDYRPVSHPLPESSEAFIYIASIRLMTKRLAHA
jgi:diketogulonate reductase-like aldo/keto reductase